MGWIRRLSVTVVTISLITGCSRPVGQAQPPSPPVISEPTPLVNPISPKAPPPLVQKIATTVQVELRVGDSWRSISPLSSFTSAGGGQVRLSFSKPVPRFDIERALYEMQQSSVSGRILWEDDLTLIWQIAAFPQRLDFLLDGVRDSNDVPMPGGIPSIFTGKAPQLVEVDLLWPIDLHRAVLPPDLATASLSQGRQVINFQSWRPGINHWDWSLDDYHLDMTTWRVGPGLIEGAPHRFAAELEGWQVSPDHLLVAGFRMDQNPTIAADLTSVNLVVTDLRGGRRAVAPGFVNRSLDVQGGPPAFHLAWSPDSRQVIALSHRPGDQSRSDLIAYDVSTGVRSVLVTNLPVYAHSARLSWSSDGSWVLVGNLVIDLATRQARALKGSPELTRGIWEPGGTRLLYTLEDWGDIMVIQMGTTDTISIGRGLMVAWMSQGRLAVVRWPGSDVRYQPPWRQ